ncbi:MAG: hypothetical protein MUE55_00370 [Thermoplasmata archaeon]|nr:hypothetical protein [Thermoplasmata archaeon]
MTSSPNPNPSRGTTGLRLAKGLILPALLAISGIGVMAMAFSVDALSSAGLEVPGPGIYIFALGMVLMALGLLLAGRVLPERGGDPEHP